MVSSPFHQKLPTNTLLPLLSHPSSLFFGHFHHLFFGIHNGSSLPVPPSKFLDYANTVAVVLIVLATIVAVAAIVIVRINGPQRRRTSVVPGVQTGQMVHDAEEERRQRQPRRQPRRRRRPNRFPRRRSWYDDDSTELVQVHHPRSHEAQHRRGGQACCGTQCHVGGGKQC